MKKSAAVEAAGCLLGASPGWDQSGGAREGSGPRYRRSATRALTADGSAGSAKHTDGERSVTQENTHVCRTERVNPSVILKDAPSDVRAFPVPPPFPFPFPLPSLPPSSSLPFRSESGSPPTVTVGLSPADKQAPCVRRTAVTHRPPAASGGPQSGSSPPAPSAGWRRPCAPAPLCSRRRFCG